MVLALLSIIQIQKQMIIVISFLVIGGVIMLLICISAYIFPFGKNLRDNKILQTIKALGMDLKVNVITIFVFVAIAMSSSGIYLYDKESNMSDLRDQISNLKTIKAEAKSINVNLRPSFQEGESLGMLDKDSVRCRYIILGGDTNGKPCETKLTPFGDFYIKLENITASTSISELIIMDERNENKWIARDLRLLEPIIEFTLQGQ